MQARYAELRADEGELRRLLRVGAEKAREASAPTLGLMYERMGFVDSVAVVSPVSQTTQGGLRVANHLTAGCYPFVSGTLAGGPPVSRAGA